MCLGIPGKIIALREDTALATGVVDFGGAQREVCLAYVDGQVAVGDYVVVHVGFAISKIDEEEVFVFGGITWAPHARVSLDAEYQFSRNVTDYDLTGTSTLPAVDLPSTIFRNHHTMLDAQWRWLENTSIIGRWAWEDYDVNDFASNAVPLIFPTTGTANAIFLGDSSQGYRAHRLALLVKHSF